MGRRSLIVFGPADGFKAFRLPKAEEETDNTLAIPDSELSFADGSVALLLSRPPGTTTTATGMRVGIYKQVYEQDSDRRGYSFGAVLEFYSDIPSPAKVLEVLHELLGVIERLCVRNRQFCRVPELLTFLEKTLSPGFDKILKDVDGDANVAPTPIRTTTASQQKYSYQAQSASGFGPDIIALVNWFATDLSATQCSRIVVYSPGRAEPLLKPVPPGTQLQGEAFNWMNAELAKARRDAQEAVEARIASAMEKEKLRVENENLSRELNNLRNRILREPPDTAPAEAGSRPTLTEQDFARIRKVTLQALEDFTSGAREQMRKERASTPRPVRDSLSLTRVEWMMAVSAFLIVFVAFFGFSRWNTHQSIGPRPANQGHSPRVPNTIPEPKLPPKDSDNTQRAPR